MTTPTPTAQNLLEELHHADLAYRNAEIIEERRAQREKAERILAVKVNRDKIAARLRDEEEVSWERIAAAMGVKGVARAKRAVADGRRLLPTTGPKPVQSDRFTWNAEAELLTIALTLADVEPILEFTPYSAGDVEDDPTLLVAQFRRTPFGGWESGDESEPGHPVHALFFSPARKDLMAEAGEFVGGLGA